MSAMLGSRPLTPAEKQARWRSLKWLREQERLAAEAEVLLDVFASSDPAHEVDTRIAGLILDGLFGANQSAARILAAYLSSLPGELEALRADIDELRKAR